MLPDPVEIAIAWLSTDDDIEALGATVAADLVGYDAGKRWITVQVTGGTRPILRRLDAPRLDLNAYAETRHMAHHVCEAALHSLSQMPGYTHTTGVVTGLEVGVRPSDLTDPVNNQFRFVADITVYLRTL